MKYHHYIIVGAGPAGLQMGYFLGQAQDDYLILEGSDRAGSFFATQPVHRTLISINKRFNWFPEDEFNMRHDWNSLLTDDYSLLFRDYSEDLFPHADDLCRYMQDFADKFAIRIQYNTRVASIRRLPESSEHGPNQPVNFVIRDATGAEYACACLLMATGAVGPYLPDDIEGIELAEGYESHNLDQSHYENKRVAIIGRGNSAFEVANHLAGHAAIIHISLGGKQIKHAWQTHFVGDLRAINNTIIDMYQLKSLHATLAQKITKITKREDGAFVVDWELDVPQWTPPGTVKGQRVYDHVIRCTGWRYVDPALFAPDSRPAVDEHGKYPVLSSNWESSVPDMFFIGTTMRARDKKAASGFIHGFRYNVRTLFHLLKERYEHVPTPMREFELADHDDLIALTEFVIQRISTTSALFQLFGKMCDVLVLSPGKAAYHYELPVDYVLEQTAFATNTEMIMLTLEFGFDNYPPHTDTLTFTSTSSGPDCAAFLHLVARHYLNGKVVREVKFDETLPIRYDAAYDPEDGGSRKPTQSKYLLMQLINRAANVSPEEALAVDDCMMNKRKFFPWAPDDPRIRDDHGFPVCLGGPMGNLQPEHEGNGNGHASDRATGVASAKLGAGKNSAD
jgi:thioredoxin reductase